MNKWEHYIHNSTWLNFFSSKWILAIVPAISVILLIPDLFNKYNFEQRNQVLRDENRSLIFFEDIDGDETDEKIQLYHFMNEFAACLYFGNSLHPQKQINLTGKMAGTPRLTMPVFTDITGNGKKETIIFTQKNDSLFLNIIDFCKNEKIINKRFITTIGWENEKNDFQLTHLCNYDRNGDKIPEIYFSIDAGYALYPRRLFAYNYANDSIFASIDTGARLVCNVFSSSPDSLHIIAYSSPTDNCNDNFPFPYIDSCCWVMCFDQNLELTFAPQAYGEVGSYLSKIAHTPDNFHLFFYNNINSTSNILKFNEHGMLEQKQLKSKALYSGYQSIGNRYFSGFKHMDAHHIEEYNPEKMTFSTTSFSKKVPYLNHDTYHLKNIGKPIMYGTSTKTGQPELSIEGFKQQINISDQTNINRYHNHYFQTTPFKKGDLVYLAGNEYLYIFYLYRNKLYPLRYPVYLIIYLSIASFIALAQFLQKHQNQKRTELQNKISEMQLQLINSQLDPHFTFNALNTVSSKILKGEKLEAYDLMTRFSSLMRSAMLFSNKNNWNLDDELAFTGNYLELMKARFKEMFHYEWVLPYDAHFSNIHIPRLLIQNFAENAIKHAFTDVDYLGQLHIKILRTPQGLQITISDNGIGRKKAMEHLRSIQNKSGKGLELIKQQVEIFNRLNNTQISFKIEDTREAPKGRGTKVTISIPQTH